MRNTELDIAFDEAVKKVSELEKQVAPDIMLKLYAYYKQANYGSSLALNSGVNVINAFKINAWMQLKGMSAKDAKKEYIKLTNSIFNHKK
ncbi:MAG: acyl-CoA-binding protein [Polaribacter sp.]